MSICFWGNQASHLKKKKKDLSFLRLFLSPSIALAASGGQFNQRPGSMVDVEELKRKYEAAREYCYGRCYSRPQPKLENNRTEPVSQL